MKGWLEALWWYRNDICIISLCLNFVQPFKCKFRIKSAWTFLTWAQQRYLTAVCFLFFSPITISCCLHELDLFRQCEPLYLMPMKAIWTRVRERGMRERNIESVFVRRFLDTTSETELSKETACSVCIISHANTHTQSQYTHNTITQMLQISHPSFMPGCTKLRQPFINCS